MSFVANISARSAAKALPPVPLPEALFNATIIGITWPSEDDEPLTYKSKDTNKDVQYIRPTIECMLQAPAGDHDLEPEDYKQLPRKFKFDVMITEDNPDGGLLVFKNMIYDAATERDVEADDANDVPIVDCLQECIGAEVLVETRHRKWKTKEGEERIDTDLRKFHRA